MDSQQLDTKTFSALRNLLATLYLTAPEQALLASQVGIPPHIVTFTGQSLTTWQSILLQAQNRGLITNIIDTALIDFPNNKILLEIKKYNQILPKPAPEFGEDITWRGNKSAEKYEKLMENESTLLPISFLETGLLRSRSVARVRTATGELGSGFLIKDNIFVTNNHVIRDSASASTTVIQFNFQNSPNGLPLEISEYTLSPKNGFATSIKHDYTIIRIDQDANQFWGAIELEPISDYEKIKYVNIIQHPNGEHKQIALYHNIVAYADDNVFQYLTDTLPGSSGSPVFDGTWRIVALHHSGGLLEEPGTKKPVFRNEGININRLIEALKTF